MTGQGGGGVGGRRPLVGLPQPGAQRREGCEPLSHPHPVLRSCSPTPSYTILLPSPPLFEISREDHDLVPLLVQLPQLLGHGLVEELPVVGGLGELGARLVVDQGAVLGGRFWGGGGCGGAVAGLTRVPSWRRGGRVEERGCGGRGFGGRGCGGAGSMARVRGAGWAGRGRGGAGGPRGRIGLGAGGGPRAGNGAGGLRPSPLGVGAATPRPQKRNAWGFGGEGRNVEGEGTHQVKGRDPLAGLARAKVPKRVRFWRGRAGVRGAHARGAAGLRGGLGKGPSRPAEGGGAVGLGEPP